LPEYTTLLSNAKKKGNTNDWDKFNSCSSLKQGGKTARKYVSVNEKCGNGLAYHGRDRESSAKLLSPSTNDTTDDFEQDYMAGGRVNGINHPTQETPQKVLSETTYHSRKSNGVTQQVSHIAFNNFYGEAFHNLFYSCSLQDQIYYNKQLLSLKLFAAC